MAQISLRVDDEVKRSAEKTFDEIGLSENRIPFELSADPFYSRENISELNRRVTKVKTEKDTLKEHELIEVDE